MIELLDRGDGFPVGRVVALLAIRAQAPLVRIFVTSGARLGDTEKSLIQIFDLDECSIGQRNVFRAMTFVAA